MQSETRAKQNGDLGATTDAVCSKRPVQSTGKNYNPPRIWLRAGAAAIILDPAVP